MDIIVFLLGGALVFFIYVGISVLVMERFAQARGFSKFLWFLIAMATFSFLFGSSSSQSGESNSYGYGNSDDDYDWFEEDQTWDWDSTDSSWDSYDDCDGSE